MDVDCQQYDQGCCSHRTKFQKESSIQHLCNHTCVVTHEFGNVFKCLSSGLQHVCDANCSSRVYRDPYSSICLISRRVHGPLESPGLQHNNVHRKRHNSCSQDGADTVKRMNAAHGGFASPGQGCVSMEA